MFYTSIVHITSCFTQHSPHYVMFYTNIVHITSCFTPALSTLRHALHQHSPHYVMFYTIIVHITSFFTPPSRQSENARYYHTDCPLRHASHRHSPHYLMLLHRHRTHYVRLYTAKPSVGEGRQSPHCYSPRYVTRYTDTVLVTSDFTPTQSPLRHAFTPPQSPLRHALHTTNPSVAEGRLPPHCISPPVT